MDQRKSFQEEIAEKESNFGKVYKISGPIVVGEQMDGAKMHELVRVGWKKVVGEIIKLDANTVSIQCYEDTNGISIGDPIIRTYEPLSVQLGPGILNQIFDGIQRPLQSIDREFDSIFIPKGVDIPSLDSSTLWHFIPTPSVKIDSNLKGGDIFGYCNENSLFSIHNIMVPPKGQGKVTFIVPEGDYNIQEKILELEQDDIRTSFSMSHFWPVRQSRPIQEKLQGNVPLLTGQRVLDTIFPCVLGGTCCMSNWLCKNLIVQALSKYSNTKALVYVGCGERGNEITKILSNFSYLTTELNGRQEPIMKHTCLVANTSEMPVAAREASIYTGITLAEYFRDMGYNVCMLADSINRWAEAMREIYGYLALIPAENGYPPTLNNKLASFFERAGHVKCNGSPDREGSITIVGTLSDLFSKINYPVISSTISVTQVCWHLDHKLAQAKHFPSINWFNSTSSYERQLDSYFNNFDPDFSYVRTQLKKILLEERQLNEDVRQFGKDSLSDIKQLTLEIARIIREDFLQQNSFSSYDYICPLEKNIGMIRSIINYYDTARKAIVDSSPKIKINWKEIRLQTKPLLQQLSEMKFLSPTSSLQELSQYFSNYAQDVNVAFRKIIYS